MTQNRQNAFKLNVEQFNYNKNDKKDLDQYFYVILNIEQCFFFNFMKLRKIQLFPPLLLLPVPPITAILRTHGRQLCCAVPTCPLFTIMSDPIFNQFYMKTIAQKLNQATSPSHTLAFSRYSLSLNTASFALIQTHSQKGRSFDIKSKKGKNSSDDYLLN